MGTIPDQTGTKIQHLFCPNLSCHVLAYVTKTLSNLLGYGLSLWIFILRVMFVLVLVVVVVILVIVLMLGLLHSKCIYVNRMCGCLQVCERWCVCLCN